MTTGVGSIVGVAVVGHVPTLMLPEETRVRLGGGRDTTLIAGLARLRDRLDASGADTMVIVDTHWFTTTEHVVAGHDHFRGVYTSDELPKALSGVEYDYAGAPELARRVEAVGRARGLRVLNATDPHLPRHYPTINLVHHLHRGERVLSTGVCQTGEAPDFLAFGETLAAAIAETSGRVAILASGGMSHRFWPLSQILDHAGYDADHVITPEARAIDERIIDLWQQGDHAAVVDLYGEYRSFSPEGYFGHYLTMLGAVGGPACRWTGEAVSDYENSYGTGQVDIWFEPSPRNAEGAT